MGAVVRDDVTRGAKDLLSAGWRTVDGLTPMEAGTRGWKGHHTLAGAGDPQLTQAERQGRALHPQAYGGAVRSSKHPMRLLERGQEVLAFGLCQGVVGLGAHIGEGAFKTCCKKGVRSPWLRAAARSARHTPNRATAFSVSA
jgi:hypothetical protein